MTGRPGAPRLPSGLQAQPAGEVWCWCSGKGVAASHAGMPCPPRRRATHTPPRLHRPRLHLHPPSRRQAFEIALRLAGGGQASTTLWLDDRCGGAGAPAHPARAAPCCAAAAAAAAGGGRASCTKPASPAAARARQQSPPNRSAPRPRRSARNITTGHRLGMYSVLVGRTGALPRSPAARRCVARVVVYKNDKQLKFKAQLFIHAASCCCLGRSGSLTLPDPSPSPPYPPRPPAPQAWPAPRTSRSGASATCPPRCPGCGRASSRRRRPRRCWRRPQQPGPTLTAWPGCRQPLPRPPKRQQQQQRPRLAAAAAPAPTTRK